MEKEKLVDAIMNSIYSSQREFAEIIGDTQQNVSRMIKKYDLGALFAEYKTKKPAKVETEKPLNKYLEKQREKGAELWPLLLAQGGILHPDVFTDKVYKENLREFIYIAPGAKSETLELINLAVGCNKQWEDFTEQEQIWISAVMIPTKVIINQRRI